PAVPGNGFWHAEWTIPHRERAVAGRGIRGRVGDEIGNRGLRRTRGEDDRGLRCSGHAGCTWSLNAHQGSGRNVELPADPHEREPAAQQELVTEIGVARRVFDPAA